MEEPGGEHRLVHLSAQIDVDLPELAVPPPLPPPVFYFSRFLLFVLHLCRYCNFGLSAQLNQSNQFPLECLLLPPCCTVSSQVQMVLVVAVRAAERRFRTRSTPRCSRIPGTTPAFSKYPDILTSVHNYGLIIDEL